MMTTHPDAGMVAELRNVIVLLPTREPLRLQVRVKATGRELFQQVCDVRRIQEAHIFGLSVVRNNEYIFMDLEQKLSKYFSKDWKKEVRRGSEQSQAPYVTFLRVQYYVEDGRVISDRTTRHLYYCHLKERVLWSRCPHQEEAYFLLAALGLQADLGSHREATHVGRYFEPQAYFPQWILAKWGSAYVLEHAPAVHREQRGLSPREAVLRFIREACRLDNVPVHFFRLHKDKKEAPPTMVLGLTLRGVHIYQEVKRTRQLLYDFPWSRVGKLAFLGRRFEIQPDGLPSARKLVYYTGCPMCSRHLLSLLSSTHRWHLRVQPVLHRLRQLEEEEEKQHYSESYVSDTLGLQLADRHSQDSDSSRDSSHSADSGSSSQVSSLEADTPCAPGELCVDKPFRTAGALHGGCPGQVEEDTQDPGAAPSPPASCQNPRAVIHVTEVKMRAQCVEALSQVLGSRSLRFADQHSRSPDDLSHRPPASRAGPRCTPACIWGDPVAGELQGKRCLKCQSLDLLGDSQPSQEFVV